jgi:dTDP-4-amino-4,6-dideoxygalactose transaminase
MNQKKEIPFGRPSITSRERQAVMRVLEGHILTHGPECAGFEEEFAALMGDGAHCVSVSSCMAALHLAYLHLGIGPGDEVIAPALTHVATAHAIEWVGAKPVFVDADPRTGNMSPEAIEAAVTDRTKAIGLVHFIGIPCDMDGIMAVAEEHGLKVVEDCAIAIGSRFKGTHVGLFGHAGTFSFYPVKQLTTGEGGIFASRYENVATEVARLRAFGVDRSYNERKIPGFYEVVELGLNYRMSEMQAALGRVQVARFGELQEKRTKNFMELKGHLEEIEGVRVLDSQTPDGHNSHYCVSAVLEGELADNRNDVVLGLKEHGIGTSIYYPQPVPRMKYYKDKYGYDASQYPVATSVSDGSIALPVGPHLETSDMEIIASALEEKLSEVRS